MSDDKFKCLRGGCAVVPNLLNLLLKTVSFGLYVIFFLGSITIIFSKCIDIFSYTFCYFMDYNSGMVNRVSKFGKNK